MVWAETVSEEVVTVTASPVEVAAGLETALAVTSTVAPPSMVPHPELTFKATVAPPLLVAALYLIGLSLSRRALATVGVRPLALGVALWIVIGTISLPLAAFT